MPKISWEEFERVEVRIGTVIEAQDFPEAKKPAYRLKIDFGKYGIKTSSAQIAHLHSKEDLIGTQVVCVTNFHPKKIAGFTSEVLVMGPVKDGKCMALIRPGQKVEDGLRIA